MPETCRYYDSFENVEKMPEEITVMKVFKNIPEGKRSVAKL
jgi:hypothetical protein